MLLNRDVFQTNPDQYHLANQGVAKISFPPALENLEHCAASFRHSFVTAPTPMA